MTTTSTIPPLPTTISDFYGPGVSLAWLLSTLSFVLHWGLIKPTADHISEGFIVAIMYPAIAGVHLCVQLEKYDGPRENIWGDGPEGAAIRASAMICKIWTALSLTYLLYAPQRPTEQNQPRPWKRSLIIFPLGLFCVAADLASGSYNDLMRVPLMIGHLHFIAIAMFAYTIIAFIIIDGVRHLWRIRSTIPGRIRARIRDFFASRSLGQWCYRFFALILSPYVLLIAGIPIAMFLWGLLWMPLQYVEHVLPETEFRFGELSQGAALASGVLAHVANTVRLYRHLHRAK